MIEKIAYKGWPNCYKLSNDSVELILATDMGPRILSFAIPGSKNVFHENTKDLGKTGGDQWRRFCGHRLFHTPYDQPRTYLADNNSVLIEPKAFGARLFQYNYRATGIQKEIEIYLDPHQASVIVEHRLCNNGAWPVELAAWAITDMAEGGVGILPLPERTIHDPDTFHAPHQLAMWDYTDMSDPRWVWGNRYAMLRDDQSLNSSQRIGLITEAGWIAYAVNNQLFVKKFAAIPDSVYPDNCSAVLFADSDAFQLETLSPLTTLQPKETLRYIEEWRLFSNVPVPQIEADIDNSILSKIEVKMSSSLLSV